MCRNIAKKDFLRKIKNFTSTCSHSLSSSFSSSKRLSQDSIFLKKIRPAKTQTRVNTSCPVLGFLPIGQVPHQKADLETFGLVHSRKHFIRHGLFGSMKCYASVAEQIASTDAEEDLLGSDEVLKLMKELSNVEEKEQPFFKQPKKVVAGIGIGKCSMLRRQIKMETEVWKEAAEEYQELFSDMCEQKLAPNLPFVMSLFLGWFEPLRAAIVAEQVSCKEAKQKSPCAPFIDQLPAGVMEVIITHKMMALSITNSAGVGYVRVVQAAWQAVAAMEHETVMTSVYGVTYVGARDQIKRKLKECCAIADEAVLFGASCYAAKTTLTALGEMFEAARIIISWLGNCAKVIASKNQAVQWTTPLGLPVVQPYQHFGRRLIQPSLQILTLQRETDKVDQIISGLWTENPNFALVFFNLLMNKYGFKHSTFSRFVVSHILAEQRRFKELQVILKQMLEEEGSGSAPSLCEVLENSFRECHSIYVVWDALAFAYSKLEMVYDALFVVATMKELGYQASVQTYNSLLYILRHTDIIWDVYNEMKVTGSSQNEYTNSILIDGLCRQSRLGDAVSFLQEKEGTDFEPSVVSFNTIMSGYCNMGFAEVAKSLFCMMLKYGLLPDSYSYNILIHGLCMAGSMEEALEFTEDMEKHGIEPDVVTYNILAKGFHLLGTMNRIWKVIQEILLKELNPNLLTYTMLICGYCQMGNINKGLQLRDEMISQGIQLNVFSYSVLVSSLCKTRRIDEALGLLHEMEANGLKPDLVTYSILIHGLCKRGEVRKAIHLYNEMCSKKIFPNSVVHGAILFGLCKTGTISEARTYFDILTASDLVQDVVLYNIMIDGYVKLGKLREAIELYKQLTGKGITPSIVTFNSLIYGFCKCGKMAEARSLLHTIRLHGLEPSEVTYTTLMNAYAEQGNMRNMFDLLLEMKAKGIDSNHVTYTVLIKGLCKKWKLQESVELLDDMYAKGQTPDQITYNTTIHFFCKVGDFEKAFQLFNEMLRNNLEPTPVTYNVLINGLCVNGHLEDADRLMVSLQEQNITLTKVAYSTIIKAHCVKGNVQNAVLLFHQMVRKGFEISIRDYSAVINRLCRRHLITEAKFFFSMMLSDGISPDQEICEVMLNAFNQRGDLYSVFELLAEMIKFGLLPNTLMEN